LSSLSCYDNLWCCRFTPTFRRNKLPSYSGLNDLCPSSDFCDIGGGGGGGVGVWGLWVSLIGGLPELWPIVMFAFKVTNSTVQ